MKKTDLSKISPESYMELGRFIKATLGILFFVLVVVQNVSKTIKIPMNLILYLQE